MDEELMDVIIAERFESTRGVTCCRVSEPLKPRVQALTGASDEQYRRVLTQLNSRSTCHST